MLYIYKQVIQDDFNNLTTLGCRTNRLLTKGGENNGLCKEGSGEEGSEEGCQKEKIIA